jgi:hypothetical protein
MMLFSIYLPGYFEMTTSTWTTLIAIKESLSEYGFAVIDHECCSSIETLVPEETSRRHIDFRYQERRSYLQRN